MQPHYLPEMELLGGVLAHEYSDYLLDRADGRQNLENFRIALQKLAQQSNFLGFYQTWEPYLKKNLQIVAEDFRSEVITRWLEDFFGWTADEFCVIMSPSMFNAYYGATVESSTGGLIAYQIIGESGVSLEKPQFPSGLGLEHLTVHEFGHFFVNPSMESLPARAKALERLLLPVLKIMQSQAYPSITIFLNEQVLRAVEIIAARDLFDEGVDEQLLIHHKEAGFYLMDYVLEQLNFYQENRGNYPTFGYFVPFLYDSLEQYSASL